MSCTYNLYRYQNSDGSTKDWAIRNNRDGTYSKRWGKTGTKLRSEDFQGNSTDVWREISSKTRKGYESIGFAFISEDGVVTMSSKEVRADSGSKPDQQASSDPFPTQDEPRIYWRIKIPGSVDSAAVSLLKGVATGYAIAVLSVYPDCAWVEKIKDGHGDFIKPGAGSLLKENGVGSLLLLMALKKCAPNGVTVTLSHEDGVEISDQLKLESQALSFFDTDLESVRSLAERIDLIDKRLDLSTVETSVDDFYF